MKGSLTKWGEGKWFGRVDIPNSSGKRKQKTKMFYGKKKTDVKDEFEDWLYEIRQKYKDYYLEEKTFKFICDEWYKFLDERVQLKYIKYNTANGYKYTAGNLLKHLGEDVRLDDLGEKELQDLINMLNRESLQDTNRNPKRYVEYHLRVLKMIYDYAVKKGYVSENKFKKYKDNLEKPKQNSNGKSKKPKIIETEDMERILDLTYRKYPRMYWIIKFTVSTGLRRSEILGLRWEHIDENYIYVEEQYQKNELGEFDKVPLKSEKSERMIPLNGVAREVLEEQKKLQEEDKKKLGGLKDEGYVFLDELGEKFKHGYLSKKFKEIVDKLEIDGTFHTLRHTFASILIKNGCDIQAVSELLGHYDTAFTLRTYVHLFKNVKEKAIVTVDKESWLKK